MLTKSRGLIQLRGRVRWTLHRFRVRRRHGSKVVDRMPIVFGNAIPKCGSKLLFNILSGLEKIGPFIVTGLNEIKPYHLGQPTPPSWIRRQLESLRPGDVRFGYMYATPENLAAMGGKRWANFIVIRDPRDMIVSEIFYALQINPDHHLHDYFTSLEEIEAQIDVLIAGIPSGDLARVGVRDHYARFLPWLDQDNVHVVRFEDLIANPRVQLGRMLDHMSDYRFRPSLDREAAIDILQAQMAPEKSVTFRKGKAGSWKEYFSVDNIKHFKQEAGELLISLGYEDSLNW